MRDQSLDRCGIGRACVQTAIQGGNRLRPLTQFKPCTPQRHLPASKFRRSAEQGLKDFNRFQGIARCDQRVGQFHGGIGIAESRNRASRKCSIACV